MLEIHTVQDCPKEPGLAHLELLDRPLRHPPAGHVRTDHEQDALGEVRYERAYDGLALNRFAGEAWFAGPALYLRLTDTAWMSALWNAQFAGHAAGDPRSLDLTNFERHLVKVRVGIQF